MVMYLYLDSEMDNFHLDKDTDSLVWDMTNLEFPVAGTIALSSINISLSRNINRVKISSNLIQPNFYNPDGILIAYPPTKTKDISDFFPNLQYWKIDTTNPRVISLKFHNVNISTIKFAAFTFAIC